MATTKRGKDKTPNDCRECSNWTEIKDKLRISEVLASAITAIEKRLMSKDYKPTVGDYLKLLQMGQELEQDLPKEIKVTWVEPLTPSDAEK